MKTLAPQIDVSSGDVKLYMELLTSNIYYGLNDRILRLLMEGDIDMSAAVGEEATASNISDAAVVGILQEETGVEFFVIDKNRTRQGCVLFKHLNLTVFNLGECGLFKITDRYNYKHNCVFSFKNRWVTIYKNTTFNSNFAKSNYS